jgi:outer membrane protein assembly factor BamB
VAPQPAIYAEPVVHNENLFLASSTGYSYYESYSSFGAEMAPLAEAVSEALSRPWDTSQIGGDDDDDDEDDTIISTISAAEIDSGKALWNTDLEDIRIAGLLADEDRIYATGYRPQTYEEYRESLRESYEDEASDGRKEKDEALGTTQLWALDAETGEAKWKLEGTGHFFVSPIMSEEGIVFATRQNIYLISTEGATKWTYPLIDKYVLSITPNQDTLLFSTMDGSLVCLDLANGKKKWMTTTGAPAGKIIATYGIICVPGGVEVQKGPLKVIPTKRWKGSEDLLEAALKKMQETVFEPNLMGVSPENGEILWTIDKIEGTIEYADNVIYILTHHTQFLFMDATADSSDIAKQVSYLNAYDAATGKQLWRLGIDGDVSDLRLSFGTALVVARPSVLSLAANRGESSPVRLIAIALN